MPVRPSIIDEPFHTARAKLKAHLEKAWGFLVLEKDKNGPCLVQTGIDEKCIWERCEGDKGDFWFTKVQVGDES